MFNRLDTIYRACDGQTDGHTYIFDGKDRASITSRG